MKTRIAVLSVALLAAPLAAQTQRTFVASTGNDANPCSRSAPCRNFAAAAAAVLDGGEVIALDSAGYGPVVLTTNVSLIAPSGIYAGITAFTGDAIIVNAPADTVVLRGLTLNGEGAANGINAVAAAALRIANCDITGFNQDNIHLATDGMLSIEDTVVRSSVDTGIFIQPVSGTPIVTINRCRTHDTRVGVYAQAAIVSIRDSVLSTRSVNGWGVQNSTASIDVKNCLITGNSIGIENQASSTLSISDSTVVANGVGLDNAGGTLISFRTNEVFDNFTSDTSGTISNLNPQ